MAAQRWTEPVIHPIMLCRFLCSIKNESIFLFSCSTGQASVVPPKAAATGGDAAELTPWKLWVAYSHTFLQWLTCEGL